MTSFSNRILLSSAPAHIRLPLEPDDVISQAAVSTALVSVFRGNFCNAILPSRRAATFKKDAVIYEIGDKERALFFLRTGFVKVGTITAGGHELIYDVRKGGDVVGELCVSEPYRLDRAVALESTDAIPVPFHDVMEVLRAQPDLFARLVDVFCRALKDAYAQLNTLAVDDTLGRLVNILLRLAEKISHNTGASRAVELSTYLTQEELAQMVAARRERISTALNQLRRKDAVQYSNHGKLILNIDALKTFVA